jgi:cytochrome oxidase Cu insertion factor (SCO1/SenC/PrrC family)
MDQNGQAVSDHDFRGRLQLIYFGYTFCPDICPTALASAAQALELLGDEARHVQPIFITVDPARDTPSVLKRYAGYFHPRLLGLSGSLEMTRRTAENFNVHYAKVASASGDPDRYRIIPPAST